MSGGLCVVVLGVVFGLNVLGPTDLGDVRILTVDVVDVTTVARKHHHKLLLFSNSMPLGTGHH